MPFPVDDSSTICYVLPVLWMRSSCFHTMGSILLCVMCVPSGESVS